MKRSFTFACCVVLGFAPCGFGEEKAGSGYAFRKTMSIPLKTDDLFTHAVVAVSNEHKSVIARNYIVAGSRETIELLRKEPRRLGARLFALDKKNAKPTRVIDSTHFGFIPNSPHCFLVPGVGGAYFWNTKTRKRLDVELPHSLPEGMGSSPAVSPDGKVMVTVLENGVRYWNLRTFKPITPAIAYKSRVYGLGFTSDGKWLFCRTKTGLTVRDPHNGKLVAGPFETAIGSRSSIFSPTKQMLVTFENNNRKEAVWSSEAVIRSGKAWSKERRIKLDGHVREAHWVDDSHLLVVGDHQVPGRRPTYGRKLVYLVSLAKPAKVTTLVRDIWIPAVAVAPDRKHVIINSRKETICWKVGDEKPAWSKFEKAQVYFGNGDWFLLQQGTTSVVYSLKDGKELWQKDGVERARVQGANIWLCRKNGIEVWQAAPKKK